MPRWLTEGISMMEERHAGPGWGDGLSPSLVRAYERGEIAPVKDLNKGFESPRSREHLQISYLQAGLVARYLEDRHGTGKVRALVEGFARELDLEESFQEALGISPADFDREFLQELGPDPETAGRTHAAPGGPEGAGPRASPGTNT